ncbi:MAG: response regulator, partial [Thermodesulfobacteriota bacterium]|nr:response regulator [Thermodesulfobacteriota bacterium]
MRTYNILLVDDDPFIPETIGTALESKGYKVTTADSGEKAIELLNKSIFDLVITDLIMGDIDGFQVLKTGKELKPEIMAIILTGYSDVALAIDALRFGADDYLLKPCEPEEMYFRVNNCLEKLEIKKRIRQAEKELLKAKKLESLGTLAGGIAHDFNNMMTVVRGNISLAKNETKPNSTAFELLTEAEKASLRANDLTARLITFAKGGDPVKKTLHVGRLLKNSVTSSLYEYDIDCEFTIPVDIRPAEIDESQMKQVIWNIVTNSVEAMAGQGKIEVYCENTNIGKKDSLTLKHGRYVKISIKDQ